MMRIKDARLTPEKKAGGIEPPASGKSVPNKLLRLEIGLP
jgi:hypothetical protein